METIGSFIVLCLFSFIFGYIKKVGRAVGRTIIGKGSLSDNMEFAIKGFSEFQIRLVDSAEGDDSQISGKEIQCKGKLPLNKKQNVNFVISILDVTARP